MTKKGEQALRAELEKLKSQPEHKLLGETIEMFLEQDKEAFNFDRMDRVYFLFYGNKVVGSTSPVSVFMASPNAEQGNITIPVEQNVNLFDLWRPLHVRNEKFILYIYALFSAYPQLKKLCGEVNSYLITSFELLNPELQKSILEKKKKNFYIIQNLAYPIEFLENFLNLKEKFIQ